MKNIKFFGVMCYVFLLGSAVALIPSGIWYAIISLVQFAINKSGGDASWIQKIKYWWCGFIFVCVLIYFVAMSILKAFDSLSRKRFFK